MYSVIVEAEAKADADNLRSTILGTSYLCICKSTSNICKPFHLLNYFPSTLLAGIITCIYD